MNEVGMITAAQRRQARASSRSDLHPVPALGRYAYPYFVDYVKEWFLANPAFGETREDRYRLLFTGGLRIHTTIDPAVQAAAAARGRFGALLPGRPLGRRDRPRPAQGLRPRDGRRRRARLLGRPRAGRVNLATAAGGTGRQIGLGVQAVRAGGGARERHLPRRRCSPRRRRSSSPSPTARSGR